MYKAYIVDDDELIVDEMIRVVPWMDNGFEVIGSLTNSTDAVEEILEMKPDVVFCDLKMPGLNGIDMIKILKERGASCDYVMISAFDNYENVRAFFQESGFDYILKPVQVDEIQLVLERLVNRYSQRDINRTPDSGDANDRFSELVRYVDNHFNEKISLDMLAKKFNFSKNYICSLFSKKYNTSLTCFITAKRMTYAKEMLSDSTKLLKEIAVDCGYSDYVHFFKVFKEYYGISPKEIKEKQ